MKIKRVVLAGLLLTLFVGVGVAAAAPVAEPVSEVEWTPTGLVGVLGGVLSLIFSFVPSLRVSFAELTSNVKRGVLVLLTAAISLSVWLLGAANVLTLIPQPDFSTGGLFDVFVMWASAFGVSQLVYLASPQLEDVTTAKRQLRPS